MFRKAGSIVLPLIVLAGLRRCPQQHMPCMGCNAQDDLPGTLILASVLVVAAVAAYFFTRKRTTESL